MTKIVVIKAMTNDEIPATNSPLLSWLVVTGFVWICPEKRIILHIYFFIELFCKYSVIRYEQYQTALKSSHTGHNVAHNGCCSFRKWNTVYIFPLRSNHLVGGRATYIIHLCLKYTFTMQLLECDLLLFINVYISK